MTDLPEIYAICSNAVCNHVWTSPPTRPCPSCGTDMTPKLVSDSPDGSPGISEDDITKLLAGMQESNEALGISVDDQIKALMSMQEQMKRNRLSTLEKHGLRDGDPCPNCLSGRMREYPGQEDKETDILMVCDSAADVCGQRLMVDRVTEHPLEALFNKDHSDPPERSE